MAHKFKKQPISDEELQRRTAEWIDSAVLDLSRAADCAEGRTCRANISNLQSAAKQLAESIRKNRASMDPTTKSEEK